MKTILITGASHGIGKAIAEKLAACGMRLFFLVPSTRLGLFFCGNDSRNGDVFYGDVFGEENFDNIVQRKFERAIIGKGINQAGGRFCRDVEPFCRTAVPIVMEHSGNKKQPAGRQAV